MSYPIVNEDRWDQVWIFLSLNLANLFRTELLFPSTVGSEEQLVIRQNLRGRVLEEEPFQRGVMKLFRALDPNLSNTAGTLFFWGEYIFGYEGPDRIAETIWHLASYWLQNHRVETAKEWVYELMDSLRTDQNARKSMLEHKIGEVREGRLSDWDLEWGERSFGDIENIFTTIRLISTYNSFLLSWHKIGTALPEDKLNHLFTVAIEIAKRNKFPHAVPYPNSWCLWTRRFLEAGGAKADE